ncbi:MAG: hypothetical protein LBR29_01540 [Methylobacteriaceae bacterium]|nr:hypothetical protein [Methylobacteriaceae bacterium]
MKRGVYDKEIAAALAPFYLEVITSPEWQAKTQRSMEFHEKTRVPSDRIWGPIWDEKACLRDGMARRAQPAALETSPEKLRTQREEARAKLRAVADEYVSALEQVETVRGEMAALREAVAKRPEAGSRVRSIRLERLSGWNSPGVHLFVANPVSAFA